MLGDRVRHFTLRSAGKRIGRIPPTMIRQMIVHHGVEVTQAAMERISALGVPLTFLNREGRISSRLCPPWRNDPAPRLEQARAHLDFHTRLLLARRWVDAKLANAAAVISRHASNYPDPELLRAAAKIRKIRSRAAQCKSIDRLMGYEGAAGRTYFSVFNRMLRADWAEFTGRNRRPPRDPVNALLSYTYAILANELQALIEGVGLDPYIGFLHGSASRRASLALDLMEPFRPVLADRLCLRLINLGTLKPEHFQDNLPQPGILLTRDGRLAVLDAVVPWSDQCDDTLSTSLNSPRGLLTREVERLAAAAKGDLSSFRPFYLLPEDIEKCPALEP
jgi:CRISPR-associated protein Cas1